MDWRNSGWNGLLHLLAGVVLAASGLPGPVLAQSGSGAVYYLHTDHLNTPRLVTDEQNLVIWRSLPLAEPFGNTPPEEDPDGNGVPFSMNLRFPGQYFDKETNTNYNYFRDYNPQTGRYIQSDPIGLNGGINTYGYVEGNPLSKADPMGLEAEFCSRSFYPVLIVPAQHCFVRFDGNDSDTLSFSDKGVTQDPAPNWWPERTCNKTKGDENDSCVRREMNNCKDWALFKNNCCHCVQRALENCGLRPAVSYPNYPINPAPRSLPK